MIFDDAETGVTLKIKRFITYGRVIRKYERERKKKQEKINRGMKKELKKGLKCRTYSTCDRVIGNYERGRKKRNEKEREMKKFSAERLVELCV